MFSILIVDDHLVTRRGLKQILKEEFRDIVFGEAGTAADALFEAAKQPWDMIVLDLSVPGAGGFEILEQIRQHRPTAQVLVLTMHRNHHYAARAFSLGALAYVTKDAGRTDLLAACHSVLSGRKYLSPPGSTTAVSHSPVEQGIGPEVLSPRERTVLLKLAAGKRILEIAAELNVHEKTVSTYRRRILDKLQLTSTADLVHYAIDHKLT